MTVTSILALEHDSYFVKIGMWKGRKNINFEFIMNGDTKSVLVNDRGSLASEEEFERAFSVPVGKITAFIDKEAPRNSENKNGITNKQLAMKIVRASVCFGNDPYFVAAKLFLETRFDKSRRSSTGAIGISQLTGRGIDEVNDQMGSRGKKYAPKKNKEIFALSVGCYFGSMDDHQFSFMFEDGTIPKGQTTHRSKVHRDHAKEWILEDIDRDLIYGNLLLKTYLAANHVKDQDLLETYRKGMEHYNGEDKTYKGVKKKVIYAQAALDIYLNLAQMRLPVAI